jgi:uncharacterized protein (DUF58 family)
VEFLDDQLLRRLERLSLVVQRDVRGGIGGEYRSRARAHAADFVDYRAYSPGDDLRRIDWNVYRRLGQLHIKLAEAHEHLISHVLLDCSASMDVGTPNKLAYARALAAAIAFSALGGNDVVSAARLGHTPQTLGGLRGRRRAMEMLRFFETARADGQLDLTARMRHVPADAKVVLVSDLLVPLEDVRQVLERLDVVVIQVLSPDELAPAPGGDFVLIDAETGQQRNVALSIDAIGRYRRRLDAWLADISALCAQHQVPYVRVATDEPLEDVILGRLRRSAVLT